MVLLEAADVLAVKPYTEVGALNIIGNEAIALSVEVEMVNAVVPAGGFIMVLCDPISSPLLLMVNRTSYITPCASADVVDGTA